jgi:hypothetical protein
MRPSGCPAFQSVRQPLLKTFFEVESRKKWVILRGKNALLDRLLCERSMGINTNACSNFQAIQFEGIGKEKVLFHGLPICTQKVQTAFRKDAVKIPSHIVRLIQVRYK